MCRVSVHPSIHPSIHSSSIHLSVCLPVSRSDQVTFCLRLTGCHSVTVCLGYKHVIIHCPCESDCLCVHVIPTVVPTADGSSDLLILQPITAVLGSSDCAMLSSLLNIWDSLQITKKPYAVSSKDGFEVDYNSSNLISWQVVHKSRLLFW